MFMTELDKLSARLYKWKYKVMFGDVEIVGMAGLGHLDSVDVDWTYFQAKPICNSAAYIKTNESWNAGLCTRRWYYSRASDMLMDYPDETSVPDALPSQMITNIMKTALSACVPDLPELRAEPHLLTSWPETLVTYACNFPGCAPGRPGLASGICYSCGGQRTTVTG